MVQMTAFAARLALDCQRVQSGYIDCVPCLKLSPDKLQSHTSQTALEPEAADAPSTETMTRQMDLALAQMPTAESGPQDSTAAPETGPPEVASPDAVFVHSDSEQSLAQLLADRLKCLGQSLKGRANRASGKLHSAERNRGRRGGDSQVYGVTPALHWYMKHVHAPALAKPVVQLVVLAVFVGLFVLSLAALPHVSRYDHHACNSTFSHCFDWLHTILCWLFVLSLAPLL